MHERRAAHLGREHGAGGRMSSQVENVAKVQWHGACATRSHVRIHLTHLDRPAVAKRCKCCVDDFSLIHGVLG